MYAEPLYPNSDRIGRPVSMIPGTMPTQTLIGVTPFAPTSGPV